LFGTSGASWGIGTSEIDRLEPLIRAMSARIAWTRFLRDRPHPPSVMGGVHAE
jgi:hypothetical protein